jgi:hypothetical protein
MIISHSDTQQDTIKGRNNVFQDTIGIKTDSFSVIQNLRSQDTLKQIRKSVPKSVSFIFADTTAVCNRNSIADVTFYDSTNLVTTIESQSHDRFPFIFTEKAKKIQVEARTSLVKQLKEGKDIPARQLHDDWSIIVILIAAFFYSIIRTTSKNVLPGVARFFLFRGINDPSSRDTGGLFHWQSTIVNLISFFIIGIFAYYVTCYYNLLPSNNRGVIIWLIIVGIIIAAVTIRHLVCLVTGGASSERDVFREYILGIYQSYRFSALLLFILIILMSYTMFFPVRVYITSGIIVLGLMYLIRVIRLLIIFINRNISIFYLILYLCALEILPVVISVKYFTGLV